MLDILKNKNNTKNIINDEITERKNKFFNMKKQGLIFPDYFIRNTNFKKIHQKYYKKNIDELKELNIYVSVTGRMIQKRVMGKASFCTLQDLEGNIQIYVNEKKISSDFYNQYFKKFDIGDILGVTGFLFKTKTKELSIYCDNIKILAKSLQPFPNKFHGLSNQEIRYRKRYLDLISNNKLYKIFKYRSNIIAEIRNFMIKNDFLEVETPMLQSIPGGANARPFVTYHNEINAPMYLRIAPELYLKQLIIGGFDRIFELNRNFRNEGVSSRHNPEFTMMEAYIAYSNYEDMMQLTENILKNITQSIFQKNKITFHQNEFDFSKPFNRLTMKNAILQFNKKITFSDLQDLKKITLFAESIGIKINKKWTTGQIENEIFEKTVEKKLIQPTFITQYPVEVSPLARRNNLDQNITDRFELFIAGYEIANGFSELNDAEDQKNRFLKQIEQENKNDNHNIFYDADYIEALKYGLPPTSGLGIGIDRLVMILTNQTSIRDVILFPTLRSLNK